MKLTTIFLLAAASILPAALVASPSDSANKDAGVAKAGTSDVSLQVSVDVPATMRPWVSDDIAEAFANRVGEALDRQGFKGDVAYVDPLTDPDSDSPLLKINVVEWRTNHIGSVDCTFSATLVTPKGTKDLGLFTGSSMLVGFPRHDWFARREEFDDAARRALSDLFKRIKETDLIVS